MCITTGPGNNQPIDKNNFPKVDRTDKTVPVPPEEATNNTESVFGEDNGKGVKNYPGGDDNVPKSIRLCASETDEPEIKVNPDDKDKPEINNNTTPLPPEQGPFEKIKLKKTNLKELFDTEIDKNRNNSSKDKPENRDSRPQLFNCTFKIDPNKKDQGPKVFTCTYKIEPGKKNEGPKVFTCTFKLEFDNDEDKK